MSGPDRIFAWAWEARPSRGQWSSVQEIVGEGAEYIRRDRAVIAALPEVQALIAGVLGQAASMMDDNVRHAAELGREIWPIPDLRTLTPAAALAARDAMIAEAETRALAGVTTLHTVISDIRAATVGITPMLSDLAQALVSWRDEAVAKEREDCARMVDCGCEKGQKAAVIDPKNGADRARACGQYNCGAEDAAAIRKRGEWKV